MKQTVHSPGIVALLGRGDTPTDALEDYCHRLGMAMERAGQPFSIVRMPWAERGWFRGITWLWHESYDWRGRRVMLQYTALGWSRRGFPLGAAITLWIARHHGAKCAIVFHDTLPYAGTRWTDRFRRSVQMWVMRRLYAVSLHSIMTVPVEKCVWLPAPATKAEFIPIGANLSGTQFRLTDIHSVRDEKSPKTVAIFGLTGTPRLQPEVEFIAQVILQTVQQVETLRLLVVGRNAEDAELPLRKALVGSKVELDVHGVLPADEIERHLCEADVLLFVRGGISSRRGSALAGIACGLPVVAFQGVETGPPITEAGVMLCPEGDRNALANNLACVLSDKALQNNLRIRSIVAREKYFSWDVIAGKFLQVLNNG